MPIATLTSKGQTTIPKEIRQHLNLKPGDQISYTLEGGNVVLRARNKSLKDLAGMLKRPGQPVLTIEEMNEAIGQAISDHVMGK